MTKDEILGAMILRGARWGAMVGTLSGILFGFPIFIIGALFGLFIGAIVGFILGGFLGLIIGIITINFYFPLNNTLYYRLLIALICAGLTVGTISFIVHSHINPVTQTTTDYWYIALPIVSGLLAIVVSQKLANWYIHLLR